jgi:hypothetical protein
MFPPKQQMGGGMFGGMGRQSAVRPSGPPPMQQSGRMGGGIGPSMNMGAPIWGNNSPYANRMGMNKPPMMGQQSGQMPEQQPPMESGGLGPSMAAFGNMMQQPQQQGQASEAMQPQPQFGGMRQPQQMYNPQMKMY